VGSRRLGAAVQPAEVAVRRACFTWRRLLLLLFLLQVASLSLSALTPSLPWLLYESRNSPKRFTWRWQGCYAYDTGVNDVTVPGCDPLLPSQLLYAALACDAAAVAATTLLLGAAAAAEGARALRRAPAAARRALAALRRAGPRLARAMALLRVAHLALCVAALAVRDAAQPPNAWSVRQAGWACLAAAAGCSAATVVGWAALGTSEMWRHAAFADLLGAEAARVRGVLAAVRPPPPPQRAVGGYAVGGAALRLIRREKELPVRGVSAVL
jgi:hypothetical protein